MNPPPRLLVCALKTRSRPRIMRSKVSHNALVVAAAAALGQVSAANKGHFYESINKFNKTAKVVAHANGLVRVNRVEVDHTGLCCCGERVCLREATGKEVNTY